MNTDKVRASFESWFTIADGVHYSVEGDEYITTSQNKRYTEAQNTQYAWEGYQQATKESEAEIAALRSLAVFMCETWTAIDHWVYEDIGNLSTYPVIQGSANQGKLRRFGEQKYNKDLIPEALKEADR